MIRWATKLETDAYDWCVRYRGWRPRDGFPLLVIGPGVKLWSCPELAMPERYDSVGEALNLAGYTPEEIVRHLREADRCPALREGLVCC